MSWRKKALLLVVLPLLGLVGGLELLGYALHRGQASAPNAATAAFRDQFYEYDPDLIVRLRPAVRGDFRAIRPDLDAEITVNSAGFRGAEHAAPDPAAFRVAVFGDSVSFGLGVGDDQTWPARLRQQLAAAAPGRRVQVRNLAVPGYSTAQGVVLFARHTEAGGFAPQLAIFAFGFNDGYLRPHDDRATLAGERWRHTWLGRAAQWLEQHSHLLALLWSADPDLPQTVRVPPAQLRANLQDVVALAASRGVALLLVDASLPHCYARDAIAAVAAEHGLPHLSFRAELAAERQIAEGRWPRAGQLRVVVDTHGVPLPPAPAGGPAMSMVWLPDAGEGRFEVAPMNDAGDGGDERAGDGRWSCAVEVAAGARPELALWIPGFAPQLPEMAGPATLLNSVHRYQPGPAPPGETAATLVVDGRRLNHTPWPELVLPPDPIHASAAGCAKMADAVARAVLASRAWAEFAR